MRDESIENELNRLRAENAALKRSGASAELSFKVSPKGAVSVYGLGRFPVTLYQDQWRRLLAKASAIEDFIVEHAPALSSKKPRP